MLMLTLMRKSASACKSSVGLYTNKELSCVSRMVRKKKMRDPDFVLCVLLPNAQVERFKITDIHNFSTSSVEDIKYRASQRTGLHVDELDLSYRGCILQSDKKISECDFKKGATIFVTKKKQPAPVPEKVSISDPAVKAVSKALKKRTTPILYWSYLEKMKKDAGMEILIARNPGLISDPVSLAILLDSDLLENLSDLATAKKAAELHPALLGTLCHVMNEIAEEKRNDNSNLPSASLSLEAALANHSDDMDALQSDPIPGSSSQNRVNVSDAALLASLGEMSEPYHVEDLASSSSSSPMLITPEMVSQAMQSAMASVAVAPMPSMATSSTASTPSQSGDSTMLGIQLHQMQELGLLDIGANMQALLATGGDVQAAINLLLSGAMTSDDEN